MCCIACAKCLGGVLVPLSLMAILTNILLCFPAMTIVEFEQLSDEITYFGGIIGCGIMMLFPAFSFLRLKKLKIWKFCGRNICGPRCRMFDSMIKSIVGIIGASYGVAIAWAAIKRGPKCDVGYDRWDYPFHEWNYLTDKFLWTKCKNPKGIVPWNLTLFSIQLAIGFLELILCIIQMLNGFFGTICGQWKCEQCVE